MTAYRMRKQDKVDESDEVKEAGAYEYGKGHEYSRSFSPSNLRMPSDFVHQRLGRESSLEAVHERPGLVYTCSYLEIYMSVHVHVHVQYTCT